MKNYNDVVAEIDEYFKKSATTSATPLQVADTTYGKGFLKDNPIMRKVFELRMKKIEKEAG